MRITDYLYKNRNNTKTAVKCGSSEITYAELWEKSCKTAAVISELEDSIIGIAIPNSIEYIIAYFAVMISGKAVLPINQMYSTYEFENIANVCSLKSVISLTGNAKLWSLDKELHVIELDQLSFMDCDIKSAKDWVTEGLYTCEENESESDKVALIIPTSGTTSIPKLVQLTNRNVCTNVEDYVNAYDLREVNHELILLPLTSSFCNTTQLLACLSVGMTISILPGQFQMNRFFEIVERDQIHSCSVTPSLLKLISRFCSKEKDRFASFQRFSYGGEVITREELNEIRRRMPGILTVFGYGMTEAGPVITTQTPSDYWKAGTSVGRPLEHVEIKIIDNNGQEAEIGIEGEIIVRGPNVMKGYYGLGLTSIENGWLHTGDIGCLNSEGYLSITGRKKNVIITAGQNVCVEEVEAVLNSMDNIMESRVLAERDSNLGEIVTAQVVVIDRDEFNREKIISHCESKMAAFKIPKKIYIIDKLDRNANGKIIRS